MHALDVRLVLAAAGNAAVHPLRRGVVLFPPLALRLSLRVLHVVVGLDINSPLTVEVLRRLALERIPVLREEVLMLGLLLLGQHDVDLLVDVRALLREDAAHGVHGHVAREVPIAQVRHDLPPRLELDVFGAALEPERLGDAVVRRLLPHGRVVALREHAEGEVLGHLGLERRDLAVEALEAVLVADVDLVLEDPARQAVAQHVVRRGEERPRRDLRDALVDVEAVAAAAQLEVLDVLERVPLLLLAPRGRRALEGVPPEDEVPRLRLLRVRLVLLTLLLLLLSLGTSGQAAASAAASASGFGRLQGLRPRK
mmetsp:Transcript_40499/g.126694  ORF Transcript_40499/g.126694 Transcript_40499/m.126694 type:complete len:312 (+) Transcript_40499:218-1153(+)